MSDAAEVSNHVAYCGMEAGRSGNPPRQFLAQGEAKLLSSVVVDRDEGLLRVFLHCSISSWVVGSRALGSGHVTQSLPLTVGQAVEPICRIDLRRVVAARE